MKSAIVLCFCLLCGYALPAWGEEGFACAGWEKSAEITVDERSAAKIASLPGEGGHRVVVIFARFADEEDRPLPDWADLIFDAERAGSFSHFFDAMSFGRWRVRGEVAARRYASLGPASDYLADEPTKSGQYGRFCLEILEQADREIDFAQFDDDGPDGLPGSGDDDGYVDAVFVNLLSSPQNFLRGNATGVAGLGLERDFVTGDRDATGRRVRIAPRMGTVQRARDFVEAVGSMCHEYGHVLGLPDLYNTSYLVQKGAGPEEDSAGIGGWGLMGWGAMGWNGDDGPNSLCAWSRMQLGWGKVVEIAREREEMRLPEVGREGEIYRIPLGPDESFLLEHRRRTSSYYDRHLPGEGLLIWHIHLRGVDLECADGRWLDAGYPLGETADAEEGGDNLDFWAHDAEYARLHAGNLGDDTDPFDGVRYRTFTSETNPASFTIFGRRSVHVEAIEIDGDLAKAQVQTAPPLIEVDEINVRDGDRDGMLNAGEEAAIWVRLANRGGMVARDVRVKLVTEEPLLELVREEVHFGDVWAGRFSGLTPDGPLKIRLKGALGEEVALFLTLEVYADGELVESRRIRIEGAATFALTGRVTDEEGAPLAGAVVLAGGKRAETRAGGLYELNLRAGSYGINVFSPSGNDFGRRYLALRLIDHTRLDVVLRRIFPVPGVVRDPEGVPLAGVALMGVWEGGSTGEVTTGEDGTFTLMLPRGWNRLKAERKGWGLKESFPLQSFEIWVEEEGDEVELVLEYPVEVWVRVLDEDGRAAPPTEIAAWSREGYERARTDEQGRAAMYLLPDVYRFDIFPPFDPYLYTTVYPLAVAGDASVQVTLEKGYILSGAVADESVKPFLDGMLMFFSRTGYYFSSNPIETDGTYRAWLAPGEYQVTFFSLNPGRSPTQVLGSVVVTGDGKFDFSVREGMRVRGQLLSGTEGAAGIDVLAVSGRAQVAGYARTEEDGSFAIFLQPGRYEFVGCRNRESFWHLGTEDVPPLVDLEFRLPDGASLTGKVVDASGLPVTDQLVVLTRDPLELVWPNPDRDSPPFIYHSGEGFAAAAVNRIGGSFQLTAAPGEYAAVVLPYWGSGVGVVERGVELAGERDLDLMLPEVGQVYQVYGKTIFPPNLPRGIPVLQFYDREQGIIAQTTGRNGGYDLELPPGRYRARVGLLDLARGFYAVYDADVEEVTADRRWDLRLDESTTAVAETERLPESASLAQNFPNPFNPSTTVRYRIPKTAVVHLVIYDILGCEVQHLVREAQPGGDYEVRWNGRDADSREVGSGIYLCRMTAQLGERTFTATRKLALIR